MRRRAAGWTFPPVARPNNSEDPVAARWKARLLKDGYCDTT